MRLPAAVVLSFALIAPAQMLFAVSIDQFNQFVVFGDSLSDTGNVSISSSGLLPGSNYAPGRFTNGTNTTPAVPPGGPQGLWIDQLSAASGIADPAPFLSGGTNYAVGLATTGSNGLYDVGDQVNYYNVAHGFTASPSSLYFFWAGADDLVGGSNSGKTAADNLFHHIQTLAGEGGKYFVWFNLPPLGATPRAKTNNAVAALNAAASQFNAEWSVDVQTLQAAGVDVIPVDVNNLFAQIAANPSFYGFDNITDSARGLSSVNPDTYLFWDDLHPTTAGHSLIAQLVGRDIAAIPEPLNFALVLVGLSGLLLFKGRLRTRGRPR
ncbi:MAG: SGNH/GDSL hydrolase family protein [Acidobacteriaceae bacterium]|nr:SGNH/GDSL hydrolase family protein [Acidobacteriaceae bacterium]